MTQHQVLDQISELTKLPPEEVRKIIKFSELTKLSHKKVQKIETSTEKQG